MKTSYTIFTAEGVSYEVAGTSLKNALNRAQTYDHTPVAIIETASLVQPAKGALTALVVMPRRAG